MQNINTSSPGGDSGSAESDDHEGEARDTLAPLPDDLHDDDMARRT